MIMLIESQQFLIPRIFAAFLTTCICFFLPSVSQAEFDTNEAVLTPSGISTADTLHKGEKFFAPQGWLAYGVTDRLTVSWDWFVTFGGIPAGFLRYQIPLGEQAIAVEIYGAHFRDSTNDERVKGYMIEHRGETGWVRLNWSSKQFLDFRSNAYIGKSYYKYLRYAPANGEQFQERVYDNDSNIDYGLGLEWLASPSYKAYLNYFKGNTFTLFDQIPHKSMVILGLRFTPFDRSRSKILSRMRLELNAIAVDIPDANYEKTFPIYPVLYWQW